MIAKVIVDVSLDKEFDYLIPAELSEKAQLGSRVSVPFGRRHVAGYIIGFSDTSQFTKLKPIENVIGAKPYLNEVSLKLARWMSSYYCASIEQCIRTLLPGAVRRKNSSFKQQRFVTMLPEAGISDQKLSTAQQKIVTVLNNHNGKMLLTELLNEAQTSESPIKTLVKRGILKIEVLDTVRNPLKNHKILKTKPLQLTSEQSDALQMITEPDKVSPPRPILLYGVTGSGKTEVYLQAIAYELEHDRGSIVLVPEISLTPQTIRRFLSRFGNRIAVLHSHLSDGERHDEWHRILNGEAVVVIGARSAVFAPVRNLGLIVVDEEHEPSYKQSESPRYNARDLAVMRGYLGNCKVVLGSATPAIESWANTQNGKYCLATLSQRADDRRMPNMRIIDMRIETERTGYANVFSKDLLDAIQLRLNAGEQTMLFLNRRGYSASLVCPKCGYVAECDQCSVSHTYHRAEDRLRCHICGGSRPTPLKCPQCGDPSFKFAGMGTQRVETVIKKCFPKARVMRMDADTTRRKNAYDEILGDFRSGKIDILVGTQMIAKGLHFPNVTLVGVIYADLSLHVPDFRASERTFQLLAQVAGRAGRGDVAGEVIVQTYTPHHTAIQAARNLDYEGLCAEEIEFRKELMYPPAAHLICITLKGKSEPEVKYCTELIATKLDKAIGDTARISDACPAPLAKAKGFYRYQIILRGRSVSKMANPIKQIFATTKLPKTVTAAIDVDALDLM